MVEFSIGRSCNNCKHRQSKRKEKVQCKLLNRELNSRIKCSEHEYTTNKLIIMSERALLPNSASHHLDLGLWLSQGT